MARTNVAAETLDRDGLAPAFTAAIVDGHMTPNNGRIKLRFKNTDASPKTITVLFGKTVDGQTVPGKQIVVPATTGDVEAGLWPPHQYNQADGRIWWDYSATTGVSVAVVEVPPVT